MSIHIGAKPGEIADTVLLPGDPLRAKFIAENLLDDAVCHNEVRGMYGFTGTYQGKPISVQGTGMGIPSISIYAHELIAEYGVSTLIRVGTSGGIQPDIKLRDVILAMSASTDSNVNGLVFGGRSYAPTADFSLLKAAYDTAVEKNIAVKVGNVLSTDSFYHDDPEYWKNWAKYGVLVLEMETSALYTIAAKSGARALSILTVSDDLVTGHLATSEERQTSFTHMVEIALTAALSLK